MHFSRSSAATALVALLPAIASAQTFTDCDATKESCEPEVGLPSSTFNSDFTQGESAAASWSEADGTTINYGDDGAEYIISAPRQAPTVGSDWMIFYGRVEVVMKAAHGRGIVSSIVLESGVLDEIDWEFLGSEPTQVQTNYYGLQNTTTYDRVQYHDISDAQADFHSYTIDWTPEQIEFLVDGNSIRTIPRASTEGRNFPQTPMQVKIGNWAAGGPGMPEGTVEWAGGSTNFDEGPFNMVVRSIDVTNYNPACSYVYSDRSGSDDSIEVITTGDSCIAGEVADSPSGAPVASPSASSSSASSAAASTSASASASASSYDVTTAAATATEAPVVSQSVNPIERTDYYNSTAVAHTAQPTTAVATHNASTTAPSPSSTSVEFEGAAALNSFATGLSLMAVVAGLWAM